jgi:glyoxylase-like metal-dependent hydrolase (beta-lactamase superfamily II)/ketosteroid isomerase-like protein
MPSRESSVTEIAPDVYRISTFIPAMNLEFNQFLIEDEQPFLFHTGMRSLFPAVSRAVATVIDPASLRWIGFSHFEADECGALREWQTLAPQATAVCSLIAQAVSVDDVVAARPAKGLEDGDVITTGRYRMRFLRTPHVPHAWDAGLFFEEVNGTLFCSDILYHKGSAAPVTTSDIVERSRASLAEDQATPFADPYPCTTKTSRIYARLARLEPRTLAVMHGSAFTGDGGRALRDYAGVLRALYEADETGADANENVVRQYVERFNAGDLEGLTALFAPDAVVQSVLGWGRVADVLPIWKQLVTSLAMHLEIEDLVTDGDFVAVRYRETGTARAPFFDKPATGKSYERVAMEWLLLRSGRIRRRWEARDAAAQSQQLGWSTAATKADVESAAAQAASERVA